jgi:hypothetical protein
MMRRGRNCAALIWIAAVSLQAAPLFYSIGPDNNGVPRNFSSISNAVNPLFNLGDGSAGFNGGLTYDSADGSFYAIANDGGGNSTLNTFTLGGAGTLSQVLSLGSGFTSGLTYDPADGKFYTIFNDGASGHSFLDRISVQGPSVTSILDLGLGFDGLFAGGLTFDTQNGLFYVLSVDNNGVSRVFSSINTGNNSVTTLFSLGDGSVAFNGGLVFNSGNGLFYAISNDDQGNSTLNSFTLGGGALSLLALGQGFNNVGLTLVPNSAVPEPSTGILVAASLIALTRLRRNARLRK